MSTLHWFRMKINVNHGNPYTGVGEIYCTDLAGNGVPVSDEVYFDSDSYSEGTYGAPQAFDANPETMWIAGSATGFVGFSSSMGFDSSALQIVRLTQQDFDSQDRGAMDFEIQVSTDPNTTALASVKWKTVLHRTAEAAWALLESRYYPVANTRPGGVIQVAASDETTAITTGTKVVFRATSAMALVGEIRASLSTAQTSGALFTLDVLLNGTSMFDVKPTFDNTEKTTTTAATLSHLTTYAISDDDEIIIAVTAIGDGTAKGLKVSIIPALEGAVHDVTLVPPSDIFAASSGAGIGVNSTGPLSFAVKNQSSNYVWASPNGIGGFPSFRALVFGDMTTLVDTDGTMAGNSNSFLPTQAAVVTYTSRYVKSLTVPTFLVAGALNTSTGVLAITSSATIGVPVTAGGLGRVTLTAYGVIIGGTTTTGATQSVSPGASRTVLTGAGTTANPVMAYPAFGVNTQSAAYTLLATDQNAIIYHPTTDTTARVWTIPANASVPFPVGTMIEIENDVGAGAISLAITSDTLVQVGTAGTTGTATIPSGSRAYLRKVTTTRWRVSIVSA